MVCGIELRNKNSKTPLGRYDMETFSELLAHYDGNPPVIDAFILQRVTLKFGNG